MKYFILLCLSLSFQISKAQDANNTVFDGHKWEAPYHLPIPEGFTFERFLIPISFAPSINYKGVEDIRFAAGWANIKSDEYWTYAFLWWLDGTQNFDAAIMESNLKAYYGGLAKANNVPAEKQLPVKTSFKETKTDIGDLKTFSGSIEMVNYLTQKQITLNAMVHVRTCPEENKTIVFYQLSPKEFTHSNWSALNKLWQDFKCKK
jgi:hypothetical protein